MHNPALQPTANPLRGLSAAELGRYVFAVKVRRFRDEQVPTTLGCVCTADGVRDGPWQSGSSGSPVWPGGDLALNVWCFQTIAAVASRHRRAAARCHAIFLSCRVDDYAPPMSVLCIQ